MDRRAFDLDLIGAGLPVAEARDRLVRAAATGAMVVTAPPGTGKTSFVPPLVANLSDGRTLLTQPRRVAARAAARRISELDHSSVGGAVGFTVRGERSVGRDTRIEVLTPGVLLRRLIDDPALDGIGAVILDEVHERSVEGDLLLGMLAEVRELREDLLLVAMSATLDSARFSQLLGDAPVVDVPSTLHPLRIDYAPHSAPRIDERGITRAYLSHLADVASRAQTEEGCDALVFVPGAREVDEVVRLLRERFDSAVEVPVLSKRQPVEVPVLSKRQRVEVPVLSERQRVEVIPLHGRIGARDQDRAVRGREIGDPPRIVVSTALAESSLTVPGVHLVIDAGLAREVRRDRGRDMAGLVTVSASRASVEQRAGRAARQGAGRTVRVYSETDLARMPSASQPEIMSADLTDAALLLAAWGTPSGLALPDAPPAAAMQSAAEVLRSLGLVDAGGGITPLGSRVARLPVGVREARALLAGAEETGDPRLTSEIVAAISDDHRASNADLSSLLRALRTGRAPGSERWRREAKRLEKLLPSSSVDLPRERGMTGGTVVALARPEWIARRAGSRGYLLASGTRAAAPEGSGLLGHEWIAVREVQRAEGRAADGTGAVIRLAAPISEGEALRIGEPLLERERVSRIEDGRVRVREERRLGAILLESTPVPPRPEDSGPALIAHLREHGLASLGWTEGATALRARLALLRREFGEPWPDVTDAALLDSICEWLESSTTSGSLASIDVANVLRGLLPWPEASRLDELAPERLAVPSGSAVRIGYPDPDQDGAQPVVAVKLQEVFGLGETPRLLDGRVPVLFHLLSPARRPLAVTDDLASFWNGPYQEVRREMRGRYPKHPWPEDPWSAQATARTKRRPS